MNQETPPGLYNAPMHAATKLNRELLQHYIDEGQIEQLLSLFEVQFESLRRAEALQMLHIHEIRTLRHQLAARGVSDEKLSEHTRTTSIKNSTSNNENERDRRQDYGRHGSRNSAADNSKVNRQTTKSVKRNPEAEIEL